MDQQMTRFSDNNTPAYGIMEEIPDRELVDPPRPSKLRRQSHTWSYFFGNYPKACAEISTNENVHHLIGKSRTHIRRHVYSGRVEKSDRLSLYPTAKEVYQAQKYVCQKIEMVEEQLKVWADSGILTYKSGPGEITLFMKETVFINFIVADDTGMFHVLISKPTTIYMGTVTHPKMEDLNKLMLVLRQIFADNQSPLTFNLDFDLDEDYWHSLQGLTLESTEEYLPRKSVLSLIHPDLLEPTEDDLEWCRPIMDV